MTDGKDAADGTARVDALATLPPATFAEVVAWLRARAEPCDLPGSVGSFDVLFVNEREVGVWLTPGRDGQHAGEHTIPTPCLAAAWEALLAAAACADEALDETALADLTGSRAHARWLVALLAALPGVCLCEEPLGVMAKLGALQT